MQSEHLTITNLPNIWPVKRHSARTVITYLLVQNKFITIFAVNYGKLMPLLFMKHFQVQDIKSL